MTAGLGFEVTARDGAARAGRLATAHGPIPTPAFMPVGTAGAVKAMKPDDVAATGAAVVLANTYHLMLRPGAERVAALGGLHRFMNWDGPILTDSGGYQALSLGALRTLDENGVTFRSHIDGTARELTPERAVEVQRLLGSDVAMALDECAPYPVSEAAARESMERSMRWAARSRASFRPREGHGLFGIAQGGVFENLRRESVAALLDIGFDGYAVGGLAVGEGRSEMLRVVEATARRLPEDRPRYLMGVGKPGDIVGAVARGIDMFDCVLPTRSGRTGQAFTRRGAVNLRNARHAGDARPLDEACACPACASYSRAYLHHLFKAREILGCMLLTTHNLTYYQELVSGLRSAISGGSLAAFAASFDEEQAAGDVPEIQRGVPARFGADPPSILGGDGARRVY